jgi:hypothetical protein
MNDIVNDSICLSGTMYFILTSAALHVCPMASFSGSCGAMIHRSVVLFIERSGSQNVMWVFHQKGVSSASKFISVPPVNLFHYAHPGPVYTETSSSGLTTSAEYHFAVRHVDLGPPITRC